MTLIDIQATLSNVKFKPKCCRLNFICMIVYNFGTVVVIAY